MEKSTGFLHIESAGFKSNGGRGKATIPQLLAEFERKPEACKHVENPMAPNLRFLASDPLSAILPRLEQLKADSLQMTGQSVRIDAQLMLAGVSSYPVPMEKLRKSRELFEEYQNWVYRNGAWIRRRWPTVYAIGGHEDEEHPHDHFFVLAVLGQKGLSLGDMHPGQFAGRKAKEKALENGLDPMSSQAKLIYNNAYKLAMQEMLDDYAEHVSKPCGFARIGKKPRKRETRADYLAQRAVAEKLEEMERVKSYFAAQGLEWEKLRMLCACDAHVTQNEMHNMRLKPSF